MQNRLASVGVALVGAIVFALYALAPKVGFVWDDYGFIDTLLTKSFQDYLIFYFDPQVQIIWYRPFYGMLWWIEYQFFGIDPTGYHLVNVLLHALNCMLLFKLVERSARSARVAFVATAIYAGLPVYNEGVLWPADAQLEATFFYLLAFWFWWTYLEQSRLRDYIVAFVFAALAIFTKETGVTLPIVFFLFDRMVIRKPATLASLIRRYLPLAGLILLYAALVYRALTYGLFPNALGYRPGVHLLSNFAAYVKRAFLPWSTFEPVMYLWVGLVAGILIWVALRKSKPALLFLWIASIVLILPALPLPVVKERYLYMSTMATATLLALALDSVWRTYRGLWVRLVSGAAIALFIVTNGLQIAEASLDRAELAREERVMFRTIAQRHPQFPADTYLYFINDWTIYTSTMFRMRYGSVVSVSDVYTARFAGLRNHHNPLVIYLNERGDPIELPVEKEIAVQAAPAPPLEFEDGIRLEGYELTQARLKRGEPFGLILFWKATRRIEKNYTVFVHLVDENGNIAQGQDSQPRDGKASTSSWLPGDLVPDGRVIFVPTDPTVNKHLRLVIGLYDLSTLQRLAIMDPRGGNIGDAVKIEPIEVIE